MLCVCVSWYVSNLCFRRLFILCILHICVQNLIINGTAIGLPTTTLELFFNKSGKFESAQLTCTLTTNYVTTTSNIKIGSPNLYLELN